MFMFYTISIAMAFIFAVCSFLFLQLSRGQWNDQSTSWPRKPILPGLIFGSMGLCWAAYEGAQLLEGPLMFLRLFAYLLVPVVIILSIFYLDYLNARGIGGFLLISSNEMIVQTFNHDCVCRGLFSCIFLLIGLLGMVALGIPWRIRDTVEAAAGHKAFARCLAVLFAFLTVIVLITPFLARC